MNNFLILHGHFYQPPRENPWTGVIPIQPSAFPYQNWNLRISDECYCANSKSRYLNKMGDIIDIRNNYEYLSFNIGPTLLNWLEIEKPITYNSILEADKISEKKNSGHGNAIAQVFNHIILPLATKEEKLLQVRWGIDNFKYHFKRAPEGIWLSETAVDIETIDVLIEENIKFIILSPWQAEQIVTESGKKIKIENRLSISNSAYKIKGTKSYINAFFYNHELAQGISFGHYLWSADDLLTKIEGHFKTSNKNLVHTATDGEIYGHHERYGDMCIAALTKKLEKSTSIKITNYGNFLEMFPAKDEIILRAGEDLKGTSWSCEHGVSRWYKDCGCSTGGSDGWNQKWRTPLRVALNELKKSIDKILATELEKISDKPHLQILLSYGKFLSSKISKEDFCKKHLTTFNSKNMIHLLTLLDNYKNAIYMYTSCGWFFAELSGIEPIQNMEYALKASEYFSDFCEENLTEILISNLKSAKSNIKQLKNGEKIFKKFVIPEKKDILDIVALFIIENYLNEKKFDHGYFKVTNLSAKNKKSGKIEVLNRLTFENYKFEFEIFNEKKISIKIYNKSNTTYIKSLKLANESKFFMPQNIYLKAINLFKECDNKFLQFLKVLDLTENIEMSEEILIKIEELSICKIREILEQECSLEIIEEIETLLANKYIRKPEASKILKNSFLAQILMFVKKLDKNMDIDIVKKINKLNEICYKNHIEIPLNEIQDFIFKLNPKNEKMEEYIKLSTQFKLFHFIKDIKSGKF